MAANRRRQPRGIALLLVVAVVAIASVLGFVMLSGATLQNRASGNQAKLVTADYSAESGINIAMYYLQYPDRAPSLNADGYWSGTTTTLSLPNGYPCTLTITVSRDASDEWTYEVVSTATVGTNAGGTVSRSNGARVYVRNEYVMKPAGSIANYSPTFNGPFTVTGDVWASKTLALKTGVQSPSVTGYGYCQSQTTGAGYTSPAMGFRSMPAGANIAPHNGTLNLYKTYTLNDTLYNCEVIPTSTGQLNGTSGVVTKTYSTTNPGGIFFRDATSGGPFVLGDNVTINGTLVVQGDLQLKGQNVVITPVAGFPALIVTGTLDCFQQRKSTTLNGICYIGTQLKSSSSALTLADQSTLTINGGLILGMTSGTPVATSYTVKTFITYDATKAKSPDLSTSLRTPKGVSIVRWGLP